MATLLFLNFGFIQLQQKNLVSRCELLVLERGKSDLRELQVIRHYVLSDTPSFLKPALQLQLQQQLENELHLKDVHFEKPSVYRDHSVRSHYRLPLRSYSRTCS